MQGGVHIGFDRFITDMDRSSNRVAFSMIKCAILFSSAIMHTTGAGPKLYGLSAFALISFGTASFLGLWLIISIIRSGRL